MRDEDQSRLPGLNPLHRGGPAASRAGFTLIELVVVLTILAVLAAATLPSFKGLQDEQIAREPLAALARLAKQARLHAIKERHPYQIAFTEKGFSATRYLSPYMQIADLDKFMQQVQTDTPEDAGNAKESDPARSADPNPSPAPGGFKEWTESYTLPQGSTYTVKFWHEVDPTPISGDTVKLWVFQPTGICPPVTVHLDRPSATFEAGFNALTADINKEVSELK
jgi:prepilin-type N-terminal cleavage/methylation domain-containing protein